MLWRKDLDYRNYLLRMYGEFLSILDLILNIVLYIGKYSILVYKIVKVYFNRFLRKFIYLYGLI